MQSKQFLDDAQWDERVRLGEARLGKQIVFPRRVQVAQVEFDQAVGSLACDMQTQRSERVTYFAKQIMF
jgi:hypothetical protein